MDGAFACPDCGYELDVKGLSPGRTVECGWCAARVEIPYIPRGTGPHRRHRPNDRVRFWIACGWAGVAVFAAVLVVFGATRLVQARSRSVREKALNDLAASASALEQEGRLEQAVAELEDALVLARESGPACSERVAELSRRRDELASREVKKRLAALDNVPPQRAIGEYLSLLARVRKLPCLAEFEDAVSDRLERSSARSVADDRAAARQAYEAGRPKEAFELCERFDRTAEHLPPVPRRQAQDEARALVTRVVQKHGVIFEPVSGEFLLGSSPAYTTELRPLLTDGLAPHGYLPCPVSSPWCPVWERHAPYRLTVTVTERLGTNYFQSRNRICEIEAEVTLIGRGMTLWDRVLNGLTRVPVRKLPALQASRLAVSNHTSPEFQRLLFDDAREALFEHLTKNLRSSIPNCGATEAPASPEIPTSALAPLAGHVALPRP